MRRQRRQRLPLFSSALTAALALVPVAACGPGEVPAAAPAAAPGAAAPADAPGAAAVVGHGADEAPAPVVPSTLGPVARPAARPRSEAPPCDSGRCAADAPPYRPADLGLQGAIARTGKRTRGVNTQVAIPQNLILADVDADGSSELLQYASNKVFVSEADFNKTGLLHLYAGRPIKRVLTGDFHGDRYDQTCLVLDTNALACYGISTDRKELWWWFTQGSFLGDNEDAVVADFTGDGRDDVLVYPRGGGAYRLYSMTGDYFFNPAAAFSPGNLGTAAAGLQLRAGDFNGDGRDDLMVVNPARQVIYYAGVNDGTNNTFWWAFTTNAIVGANDQVTVARIDDNAADDVVLRDRATGATRFFQMQYAGGNLAPLAGVPTGQIDTSGNSLLFFGSLHGSLAEPGAAYREDAMVYDLGSSLFKRADARWSGSAYTYYWVYNQYAPANHTGWAPFAAQRWLFLKCKFSDIATTPRDNAFYRNLMLSGDGLYGYWRDISYGSWDLSSSTVVDSWYTMAITNAAWSQPTVSRYDRVGYCMNAYGGSTAGYVNVIGMVNGEGDAGNGGGRVLMTPSISNVTFLAHETGHSYGYGHSFDDTTRRAADWSGPGEYFDNWDIMSAMNVIGYTNGLGVTSGPEMNAPYKTRQGFLPAQRITRLTPAAGLQTARLNVAAINRPEGNGALMVRVGADDNNYYTIEYRMPYEQDRGLSRATVLVHRVTAGVSYLITAGGTERLPGTTSSFPLGGRSVTVTVNGFAAQGYTADVSVTY